MGELESNRAAVEATIDQEMGGLRQLLNDRIDTRTAELQAGLAQDCDGRRAVLDKQLAELEQQHEGQVRLRCTRTPPCKKPVKHIYAHSVSYRQG